MFIEAISHMLELTETDDYCQLILRTEVNICSYDGYLAVVIGFLGQ